MLCLRQAIIFPARSWPCRTAIDTAKSSSERMYSLRSGSYFWEMCGLVMCTALSSDVRLKIRLEASDPPPTHPHKHTHTSQTDKVVSEGMTVHIIRSTLLLMCNGNDASDVQCSDMSVWLSVLKIKCCASPVTQLCHDVKQATRHVMYAHALVNVAVIEVHHKRVERRNQNKSPNVPLVRAKVLVSR
jgi:hypothetical protein